MIAKVLSCLALGGLVLSGVALVSKAQSPGQSGGGASVTASAADVEVISTGEEVDLANHVRDDGVYTIFDFTADW